MSGDLTNCKNCGAPLPGYPCKCEYCGTVYGKIDEWDEVRLFTDVEEFVRATSAGLVTPSEARRMLFGVESPKDVKPGDVWIQP